MKSFTLVIALLSITTFTLGSCDETTPSLTGTWEILNSEKSHCTNASMNHEKRKCAIDLTNTCINIFTDSTWTTESDTTIFITLSYRGNTYKGLVGGTITEVGTSDCTQRYNENPCVTNFLLTNNTLTLYQTGKASTPEESCLIIKELKRQ